MTNREMAQKLVEIANEIENLLSVATPEQYSNLVDIESAGMEILTSIRRMGFSLSENRNGEFELF